MLILHSLVWLYCLILLNFYMLTKDSCLIRKQKVFIKFIRNSYYYIHDRLLGFLLFRTHFELLKFILCHTYANPWNKNVRSNILVISKPLFLNKRMNTTHIVEIWGFQVCLSDKPFGKRYFVPIILDWINVLIIKLNY